MTLRGRLLAALVALLALICLIVGVVTVLALRQNLIAQVDDRLHAQAMHATHQNQSVDPGTQPGSQPGTDPGGPADGGPSNDGLLSATVVNGKVVNSSYSNNFTRSTATAAQQSAMAALPVTNGTNADVPGLGSYRFNVLRVDADTVVVTGLPLDGVNDTLLRLGITELCVALAGMIGVSLIGSAIITRTLRPLNRVAATARRVSELKLDQGEVALSVRVPERDTDPRTEVGQVGASLNAMLGHVATALRARQASESRVRQFVADASHELRTPLASVRGYAELTRRTGDDLPDDVKYAMSRVESESMRMTRLVEDMLLLARLDSGRDVEHTPVDLTRARARRGQRRARHRAGSQVAAGRAGDRGRRRRGELTEVAAPIVVPGDEQRLQQVLVNLLANARVHTPAGTKVTVSLVDAGDARRARRRGRRPRHSAGSCCRTCSTGSRAATARARAPPAAPVWAWPSSKRWCTHTAATSRWTVSRAGPGSR